MLILKKKNKEKTTVYCGRRGPAIFRWNGTARWGAQKNKVFQNGGKAERGTSWTCCIIHLKSFCTQPIQDGIPAMASGRCVRTRENGNA